jgi:hypothetical protein
MNEHHFSVSRAYIGSEYSNTEVNKPGHLLTTSSHAPVSQLLRSLRTYYRKAPRPPTSTFLPRISHRNTLEGFRRPKSKVDGNSSRFYNCIKNDRAIAATTSNFSKYLFRNPTGNSPAPKKPTTLHFSSDRWSLVSPVSQANPPAILRHY